MDYINRKVRLIVQGVYRQANLKLRPVAYNLCHAIAQSGGRWLEAKFQEGQPHTCHCARVTAADLQKQQGFESLKVDASNGPSLEM